MPVRTITLAAATVTPVPLGFEAQKVAVYNLSDSEAVYVAMDDTVTLEADGDDVYRVPPKMRRVIPWVRYTGTEFRVLSSGATTIEVEWI
jgi:hypothetical protein